MSRSVAYVTDATAVAYLNPELEYSEDWDWFIEDIQETITSKWKSFEADDGWLGNELRLIASSNFAKVFVAEYCGLVSISLVSLGDELRGSHYSEDNRLAPLADNFCDSIAENFIKTFSTLRHVATFSNGEAVYSEV